MGGAALAMISPMTAPVRQTRDHLIINTSTAMVCIIRSLYASPPIAHCRWATVSPAASDTLVSRPGFAANNLKASPSHRRC
jgi:hypothetical protein